MQGGTVQAIVGLFNMVAYRDHLLVLNWRLALLVYATVPLLIMASAVTPTMLRVRYLTVQEKIAGVNTVLHENITGVRVAKAFARENEQTRALRAAATARTSTPTCATATVQAVADAGHPDDRRRLGIGAGALRRRAARSSTAR